MNYKLSPSDLTFTYEGCKRCFYRKVVSGISPPSIPLPAVFSQIAGLLKNHYDGKSTSQLHLDLPPGTVTHGEKWVRSENLILPGHESSCYINGRFDIVVSFDDGTYGIFDFKTSNPSKESSAMYSRQLHAYAYALEHPAPGKLALTPVSRLGLLYFYPDSISQNNIQRLHYEAAITLVDIKKNETSFLKFVDQVLTVLESPEVPECSPNCQWCNYSRW